MTDREPTGPSIGLAAFHALPVIDPATIGPIGGTETRAWLFARSLARLGRDVRIAVRSPHSAFERDVCGVTVAAFADPWYSRLLRLGQAIERVDGRLRLKRLTPSLFVDLPLVAVHRALGRHRSDPREPFPLVDVTTADVWVTFGVQATSAGMIAAAHAADRPAIVVLGCDDDLSETFLGDPDRRNSYGDDGWTAQFILQKADAVVVQTPWQQAKLADRWGREGDLIANPIDLDRWTSSPSTGTFVLWVGRAEPVHKRPIEAIEVARGLPGIPFRMVMNPADPATAAEVRSRCPSNVTVVDRVAPNEMPALMREATILLNTSSAEGFPNVFLQAAASGTPIVSQTVLADWLRDTRTGFAGDGSREQAARLVRQLWDDETLRAEISTCSRSFLADNHDAAAKAGELATVCDRVASDANDRRPATA